MSTIRTDTLTNVAGSKSVPMNTVVDGSAKAWVNFNGTGTVAIRASFNVSSITDNGQGDYTVNFTNAMPDANYAAQVLSQGTASLVWDSGMAFSPSSYRYRLVNASAGIGVDNANQCVAIFR